ncbi:MAG: CIA30 family protein [Elusimicrobia bacterium]|nr:CIA30 family protein [Elusimicrobiota bacterium]
MAYKIDFRKKTAYIRYAVSAAAFLCLVSVVSLYAEDLLILDFDKASRWNTFPYKDDKGTIFNTSGAFSDEEKGKFLGVNYDIAKSGFGGWGVGLNGANVSEYMYLSFNVKGKSGNEVFDVGLKDTSSKEMNLRITDYTEIGTNWQEVRIPLADFKNINLNSLDNFHIGFNDSCGKGCIFMDDIRFAGDSAASIITEESLSNKVLIEGFERVNPYDRYIVYEGDESSLNLEAGRLVYDGDYSMELEYSHATTKPWGTWVSVRHQTGVESLNWQGARELRMWVYGDGSDNIFRFYIVESDGEIWYYEDRDVLKSTKWTLVTMPLAKFTYYEGSAKNDKLLDRKNINTFELAVLSRTGISTTGTKSSVSKIYVDTIYLVGEGISTVRSVPSGIVSDLRKAIETRSNVDLSGVVWNEYFYAPEQKGIIFHWAKIAANAAVNKYRVKFEVLGTQQNFGDAAYYTANSTTTTIGTQSMGINVSNLYVVANEPLPYITNVTAGNIWVDYTPYTFTGVWGYKGLTMEGDWSRFNYHTFLIKGKYSNYTIGTRINTFFNKLIISAITVYSEDAAKLDGSSDLSDEGVVSESDLLEVKPVADDLVSTFEVKRKILSNRVTLTATYGNNLYNRYAEASYADNFNPTYTQELENPEKKHGSMYRGKVEVDDMGVQGLGLKYEYRDVDRQFRPKYRNNPTYFDDNESDQKGYNCKISQWYKGAVISAEYDDIVRKDYKEGHRRLANYGLGYYGLKNIELGYNISDKVDVNNTESSRSEFSALNRNDWIRARELYVRNKLRDNVILWFRIRRELLTWRNSDTDVDLDSIQTKLEYYLTSNAKFFVEYKQTHYNEPSWEPTEWPYDDNFLRAYFEVTF